MRWAQRYPQLSDFIAPAPHDGHDHDPYQTKFYTRFRSWVTWCVRRRWLVIAITVAAFFMSVFMFRFVPQQFFPDSVRPELMVDMELAEGSSLRQTTEQAIARLRTSPEGQEGLSAFLEKRTPAWQENQP